MWTDPQASKNFLESIESRRIEQENLERMWEGGSNYSGSRYSISSARESNLYFSQKPFNSNPDRIERSLSAISEDPLLVGNDDLIIADEQAAQLAEELAESIKFEQSLAANELGASTVLENPPASAKLHRALKEYKPTVAGCVPSRIVFCALVIVICLQQLAGAALPFGFSEVTWPGLPKAPLPSHPEKGDFFKESAQEITEVSTVLQQARPSDWQGLTADAYTSANAALLAVAQQLAQLDRTMERYVNEQAAHVTQTQLGLGIEQDGLVAAYLLIGWLERV
ncbi:MAG: hypothetical protein K2Q25_01730, partial [Mycobacteriaceae bacterium]|nr:hypothetical protein [Mycobacteriaceae bacterium]